MHSFVNPAACCGDCTQCAFSGFNIHVRGQIAGTDGDAIENIARYMSRAAISSDRVEFNPADNTLTVQVNRLKAEVGLYNLWFKKR